MVADVAQVLHQWQERLQTEDASSTSRSPLADSSKALHIALTSLTRSRAGRAVLSAAADGKEGLTTQDEPLNR
eukprot:symbB.v1.2.000882.t1/scaffold51.1/size380723/1